ncbi:MAG: hypothetical protein P1V35_07760 [Planctomycetota bacterium]|nr:hypothetical protein [Planctomycetota bacterium]
MSFASRFILFCLGSLCLVAFAPSAQAQKVSKTYYEQSDHGFRFKPVEDYDMVPPQDREKEGGLLAKAAGKSFAVKYGNMGMFDLESSFELLRMIEKKQRVFEEGEEGASVTYKYKRVGLGDYLERRYNGVKADKPTLDKEVKIRKGLMAQHRQWKAKAQGEAEMIIDAYTFKLDDAWVHLVHVMSEKHSKKWLKAFTKSAKTFQLMERTEVKKLSDDMTYEELVEFHDMNERATGGWRAVATPSKRYIIKTDSDDDDFIDKAIARLEKSRDLYERDFPPAKKIEHVSIVRVCSTEEVFHSYGNTGGGVGGWFSPATTELVLYDGKNRDRNATYAVMSHEAFHQYCHFLFQESEAHRWFDEGHGDYYGGAKMGRSKQAPMKITPKMPAGFGRLGIIREMVQTATYAPLEDHLNYSHREWQTQGPTNVSCYAQSWSIVYMLRQGALGNVPSKVWEKEYKDIIPNYIRVLNEGYAKAYAEAREKKRKSLERLEKSKRKKDKKRKKPKKGEDGKEGADDKSKEDNFDDVIDALLSDIANGDLMISQETKAQIWKDAMAASWGDIDMIKFEENWTTYVKKHLK